MIPHDVRAGFRILTHAPHAAKATLAVATALIVLGAGCGEDKSPLAVDQLTPGELTYVTRVVTLERAKAVTLVDRPAGNALLDSLAAAWGDSSLEKTRAGLPTDPLRARLVNELLERLLVAEQDSLIQAPRSDRLRAPLPQPLPPNPPEVPAES